MKLDLRPVATGVHGQNLVIYRISSQCGRERVLRDSNPCTSRYMQHMTRHIAHTLARVRRLAAQEMVGPISSIWCERGERVAAKQIWVGSALAESEI